MIKISRSLWLSSAAVFLFTISEVTVNTAMANNDSNNLSNLIEGAITINVENLVELIQDVEPNDSRLIIE